MESFKKLRSELVHDDPWDNKPSNKNPYPPALPSFTLEPGTRPVHAGAARIYEKRAHEYAVFVDNGETRYLPSLKNAILCFQALTEELGTGVVVITEQSRYYLDMEGPDTNPEGV